MTDRLPIQAPPRDHPNEGGWGSWLIALSQESNLDKPAPAFPPYLLLLPFLAAILPAATLAALGHFDGLYGQDPFIYIDYATGPLRQSLGQLHVPPPFYTPPGYPLLVTFASLFVGARPLAGQLVSLLCGGLVAVFTTLLAREVWLALPKSDGRSRLAGPVSMPLLAGIVIAFCGQLWQSSIVVMSDTVALVCTTAGVWALARYGRRGGAGWLALATGAVSWAVMTRWAAVMIALPCAAYAAFVLLRCWRQQPRIAVAHLAMALLIAGVIIGPQAIASLAGVHQPPAGDKPAANVQVDHWSPLNALSREFGTADGRLTFRQLNGIYYPGVLALPFFFTPLLIWLILPGGWRLLRQPAIMPLCLVVGWLGTGLIFYVGVPWQNIRYALAYTPPTAILIALGAGTVAGALRRYGTTVIAIGLVVGFAWMAVGGAGLVRGFIARKDTDLALVHSVAAPPDSRLLTFGPTPLFQHYTPIETYEFSELTTDDLARLVADGRPTLLLLNLPNIEEQWQGRAPERNLRWLSTTQGLTPLSQHGPYTLFQVGAVR